MMCYTEIVHKDNHERKLLPGEGGTRLTLRREEQSQPQILGRDRDRGFCGELVRNSATESRGVNVRKGRQKDRKRGEGVGWEGEGGTEKEPWRGGEGDGVRRGGRKNVPARPRPLLTLYEGKSRFFF